MKRRLYIAAYDVTEPRRLRRMLDVVKDYATGGQKSAYECFLTERERAELMQRVRDELDLRQDRFLMLQLRTSRQPRVLGKAIKPVEQDCLLIH